MNLTKAQAHFESKGFSVEGGNARSLDYLQVTCNDPCQAFESGRMIMEALKYAVDSGLHPQFGEDGNIRCKTLFGSSKMIITPVLVNVFNK